MAVVQTRRRCSGVATQPASLADRPILFRPYFLSATVPAGTIPAAVVPAIFVAAPDKGTLVGRIGLGDRGYMNRKDSDDQRCCYRVAFHASSLAEKSIVSDDRGETTKDPARAYWFDASTPCGKTFASCDWFATLSNFAFTYEISVFFCLRASWFLAYVMCVLVLSRLSRVECKCVKHGS